MNAPDDPRASGINTGEEWEVRPADEFRIFRGFSSPEEYLEFLADLGVKMWLAAQEARKAA